MLVGIHSSPMHRGQILIFSNYRQELGSDPYFFIDPAHIDALRGKVLKSNEDMLDAII